jgi:hypothetical protein
MKLKISPKTKQVFKLAFDTVIASMPLGAYKKVGLIRSLIPLINAKEVKVDKHEKIVGALNENKEEIKEGIEKSAQALNLSDEQAKLIKTVIIAILVLLIAFGIVPIDYLLLILESM